MQHNFRSLRDDEAISEEDFIQDLRAGTENVRASRFWRDVVGVKAKAVRQVPFVWDVVRKEKV